MQPQDVQLHSQFLKQVPQLFRKKLKLKHEDPWKKDINDTEVETLYQTASHFISSPQFIISKPKISSVIAFYQEV